MDKHHDESDDQLSTARGCVNGLILSLPFWIAVFLVVFLAL